MKYDTGIYLKINYASGTLCLQSIIISIPFDADEEKSKKTLYKIADPFVDFHYRFVVPMRSFIELGRKAPIEMELQQHLGEHTSKWWEIICRDAVTGNVIDGTLYGVAKRWWAT